MSIHLCPSPFTRRQPRSQLRVPCVLLLSARCRYLSLYGFRATWMKSYMKIAFFRQKVLRESFARNDFLSNNNHNNNTNESTDAPPSTLAAGKLSRTHHDRPKHASLHLAGDRQAVFPDLRCSPCGKFVSDGRGVCCWEPRALGITCFLRVLTSSRNSGLSSRFWFLHLHFQLHIWFCKLP